MEIRDSATIVRQLSDKNFAHRSKLYNKLLRLTPIEGFEPSNTSRLTIWWHTTCRYRNNMQLILDSSCQRVTYRGRTGLKAITSHILYSEWHSARDKEKTSKGLVRKLSHSLSLLLYYINIIS